MIQNVSKLKYELNGIEHIYLCDHSTPIQDAKIVLNIFIQHLENIEKKALEQQEEQIKCPSQE